MIGAGAAILFRHQHAEKPELAEFAERFPRKAGVAVPFRRVGREQVLRDVARGVAQQSLFLGEPHFVSLIR